jgi:hypothetical protein
VPRRLLDVFFQYLAKLLAVLVAAPLLVGGAMLAIDRSEQVTTRVWADRLVALKDVPAINDFSNGTPADGSAALMQELLSTNWFVDEVLADAVPGYAKEQASRRQAARDDLRANLKVTSEGQNVVVLTYKTTQPDYGVKLLGSVLGNFNEAVSSIQTQQASTTGQLADDQLQTARAAMQQAIGQLDAYIQRAGLDPESLHTDPTYQSLTTMVEQRTDQYNNLVSVSEQSKQTQSAIPDLQKAVFRVVDPPAVSSRALDTKSSSFRFGSLALVGVAGAEFLLVYVLAMRDPRVRSIDDLPVRELKVLDLGRSPAMDRA